MLLQVQPPAAQAAQALSMLRPGHPRVLHVALPQAAPGISAWSAAVGVAPRTGK
jgi:hypothetical protein